MKNTHKKSPIARKKNDRGSILIFVVGILVLLALSATAYLATARSDRVASKQYENNTQVDLLIEACIEAVKAAMLSDDAVSAKISEFINYTSATNSTFLAQRVPVKLDPNIAFTPSATIGTNPAIWQYITKPLLSSSYETPNGVVLNVTRSQNAVPTSLLISGQTLPALAYAGVGAGTFVAGDADGDGIADSLPVKLPIGQINGITYYAYFRVVDNAAAINVNTAMSRDWDFDANNAAFYGYFNQGNYLTNIGLPELLRSYVPPATSAGVLMNGLSEEFTNLMAWRSSYAPNATPVNAYSVTPIMDNGAFRDDFYFKSTNGVSLFSVSLNEQLAIRPGNPGVARLSGITAGTPVKYKAFGITDSIALANSFILTDSSGALSDVERTFPYSVLYTSTTPMTHPVALPFTIQSTNFLPSSSSVPTLAQSSWFTSWFNYDDSTSFKPIRPLLTATSNTRNLVPIEYTLKDVLGANLGFAASIPTGNSPKVSVNTASFEELFTAFFQVMSTSDFNNRTTVAANNAGTPFNKTAIDDSFTLTLPGFDPYLGNKFGYLEDGSVRIDRDQTPFKVLPSSPGNPNVRSPQHQARMFRSPIRAFPTVMSDLRHVTYTYSDASTGDFVMPTPPGMPGAVAVGGGDPTPLYEEANYMKAGSVLLLRAAIAAANVDTMRQFHSPNEEQITADPTINQPDVARSHEIKLKLGNSTDENVKAIIFGVQRQPYITEVYANGDNLSSGPPDQASGTVNAQGYIAVELYNPHDVPIDISSCRIALLKRNVDPLGTAHGPGTITEITLEDSTIDLSTATSNSDVVGITKPTVIPPRGFLVLENYNADVIGVPDPEDATWRPPEIFSPKFGAAAADTFTTGAKGQGTVSAKNIAKLSNGAVSNFVHVANLHLLFNREFILMRPRSAAITTVDVPVYDANNDDVTPVSNTNCLQYGSGVSMPGPYLFVDATGTANYVPLDSYDLSGCNLYTSTDPYDSAWSSGQTNSWHYRRKTTEWSFIYPGRYDAAYATVPLPIIYTMPFPRQMGTSASKYWIPTVTISPWWKDYVKDPNLFPTLVDTTPIAPPYTMPNMLLTDNEPTFGWHNQDSPSRSYFSIQTNGNDWTGPYPLKAPATNTPAGNQFPFGRFARNGDIMQVPFIGSYFIVKLPPAGNPYTDNTIVEVNPITMDAAMAEDTDPDDDPLPSNLSTYTTNTTLTDASEVSREQIGRFAPLRPTTTGLATDNRNEAHNIGTPRLETYPASTTALAYNDFEDPGTATTSDLWRYHFGTKLFDYLCVRSPADDYFPNVKFHDPDPLNPTNFETVINQKNTYKLYNPDGVTVSDVKSKTTSGSYLVVRPTAVSNSGVTANDHSDGNTTNDTSENTEPLPGLININTASVKVLSAIPWMPTTLDQFPQQSPPNNQPNAANPSGAGLFWWGVDALGGETYPRLHECATTAPPIATAPLPLNYYCRNDNEDIAMAIAYWRDGDSANNVPGHGPFKSIFDLYRVPSFNVIQNYLLTQLSTTGANGPGYDMGDWTPFPSTTTVRDDGVRYDFEEQYLLMNRVSNLITTRSDTFTVYILLQGWRNAGTPNPELVTQRRASFIFDRSQYDATNGKTSTYKIPTN